MFLALKPDDLKKKTFSLELTRLTVLVAVFSMGILGIALISLSFFYFSQNARKEITYVADNTISQFQDKISFIEDGAIQMRHNTSLHGFFDDSYNKTDAETYLSLAIDLFSDRNFVQQLPFVSNVFLFNMNDEYVSKNYYPQTVNSTAQQTEYYMQRQSYFKSDMNRGNYYVEESGERIGIYFFMYGDDMQPSGVCVVVLNKEAIELLLQDIAVYKNSYWSVCFKHPPNGGTETLMKYGNISDSTKYIIATADCGFGININAGVGISNIYAILMPSILIFLGISISVLAFAVTAALVVSRRFSKPMSNIVNDLMEFAYGNMDISMKEYDIEEFKNISVVFNEMTGRIKYLVTEVYEKQLLANESQIKFLQAQINPHFMFNTLAMLSTKAKLSGDNELYKSLIAFAKLVQGKIFREGEVTIYLTKELEIVSFYLFLQNKRFRDKIKYRIFLEKESLKKCLVPRLLIESLVENAVVHGLEPKEGSGWVQVRIREKNSKLNIVVVDNGVGFDYSSEKRAEDENNSEHIKIDYAHMEHTHTGIQNMEKLLKILYGDNFEFNIDGKKGVGTYVSILIPLETNKTEMR